ncbi:MAG TPA: hypothetical protein VFF55_08220, partial [Candidatus Deferrimicrobium sp.]|nr:hypothetical protein [Candidatus Deferrimicrobium sp.]
MSTSRTLDPKALVQVTAGGASLTIVDGTVRWISAAGMETVRGIYGAVRDPNWATIQPVFTTYEGDIRDDAFEIRFRAECVREAGGIDVAWEGTIAGTSDGTIRFVFDGLCRSAFMTPRIGLCVLHPPRLAGQPTSVETLFGTLEARFPDLITQYMPFSNMVSIRHDAGSAHETIVGFEGDVFETEDQRAFTDASYKSFSRPLEMTRPYKVEAGTVVRQVVTVSHPLLATQGVPAAGRANRAAVPVVVSVGDATGRTFPLIGSCQPPGDLVAEPRISAAVRELGLAHLRASIDAAADDAPAQVDRAAAAASDAGAALDILLVGSADAPAIDGLVKRIAQAGAAVARLMAVDPAGNTTSAALAERVRAAMQSAGLDAPLVGGSRAYLYQLVSRGVPGDLVDAVSFPTNPQVHAFDEASMAETIEALDAGVRTAAALASGKPVVVGPVSLRPLFNPDLVGPELPPPPGGLPWRYDPRQVADFAAAWTLGSVAAFAAAGVAALTLHEAAGWGGLVAARHQDLPEMPAAPG